MGTGGGTKSTTLYHTMSGCLDYATISLKRERIASEKIAVSESEAVNSPFLCIYLDSFAQELENARDARKHKPQQ